MGLNNHEALHCPLSKRCAVIKSQQHQEILKKSWECWELNQGHLDVKRKCYLCAMPTPWTRSYLEKRKMQSELIVNLIFCCRRKTWEIDRPGNSFRQIGQKNTQKIYWLFIRLLYSVAAFINQIPSCLSMGGRHGTVVAFALYSQKSRVHLILTKH